MNANVYDEGRTPEVLQPIVFRKPAPEKTESPTSRGPAEWLMTGGSLAQLYEVMFQGPRMSKKDSQQLKALTLKLNPKELLETCKVVPMVDRRYSLSELPDALRETHPVVRWRVLF